MVIPFWMFPPFKHSTYDVKTTYDINYPSYVHHTVDINPPRYEDCKYCDGKGNITKRVLDKEKAAQVLVDEAKRQNKPELVLAPIGITYNCHLFSAELYVDDPNSLYKEEVTRCTYKPKCEIDNCGGLQ